MGHVVYLVSCAIRTHSIQNGGHHLKPHLVGMKPVIMPDHNGLVMDQMPSNTFSRIAPYKIIVMIPIDKYQIKFLIQTLIIKTPGVASKLNYILQIL